MSKVIVDEIQTDTTDGNVRIIPNGSGKLEVKGAGGDDAMLQLNCSAQSHGVKIKSPNHSAGQSYTMILPDNNIEAGKFLKVKSIASGSGATAVGQLEYADVDGGLSSDTSNNTIGGTNAGDALDLNYIYYHGHNTLIGYDAGTNIDIGYNNACFGYRTGYSITSGYENVCIGHKSGYDITTGYMNNLIGVEAGGNITTGGANNCIGYLAGNSLTTGGPCDLIGYQAGVTITTGSHDVCIGREAGNGITTGGNNICLGYGAGQAASPSGTISTGSNNVVLGNNSISNLYCADASISSSDSRDKTDVTDFTKGLDWIEALRPVTFRWDRRTWYGTEEEPYGTPDGSKKRQRLHLGFLAQEALAVEQANGYGTNNDDSLILNLTDDGMSYGMKYERLVPILVNAIKELSARVKTLEGG